MHETKLLLNSIKGKVNDVMNTPKVKMSGDSVPSSAVKIQPFYQSIKKDD